MLSVATFTDDDIEFIDDWLLERKMDLSLAQELPELGVLARWDGRPVCAGFLRQVEGGFALIDSLITDPNAPPACRNEAIDAVVKALIEAARAWGISRLMANSTDANTLERSAKHGFVRLPHTMIALDL